MSSRKIHGKCVLIWMLSLSLSFWVVFLVMRHHQRQKRITCIFYKPIYFQPYDLLCKLRSDKPKSCSDPIKGAQHCLQMFYYKFIYTDRLIFKLLYVQYNINSIVLPFSLVMVFQSFRTGTESNTFNFTLAAFKTKNNAREKKISKYVNRQTRNIHSNWKLAAVKYISLCFH